MKRVAIVVSWFGLVGGCLSVPEAGPSMCSTNDDCDRAHGEVCDQGTCWGNPPPGPYAALLGAPSTRSDLVGAEIPLLTIPDHGFLSNLTLEAPISFAGRVEAGCNGCAQTTIAAQITITRPSRFTGGPGYQTSIVSQDNATDTSFQTELPRTMAGDPPYQITITPKDDTTGGGSPAQLVPPLRLSLTLGDNSLATYALGGDSTVQLDGNLFDGNLTPLADYRVFALGHWNPDDPPTIVSTVDYSIDGQYHLTLASDLVDTVEIVAEPFAMGVTAPTLHLPHVDLASGSHDLIAPPALGKPQQVDVAVTGVDTNGSTVAVTGAHVFATAIVTPMSAGPNVPTHATLDADAITDGNGVAHLVLLDGVAFGVYQMHIAPPASSTFAAAFAQPLPIGGTMIQLENRLAIHGVVVDAQGNPVKGMTVTAKPALQFALALDAAPQQFLAQIPTSTAVTTEPGDFVVFVDHLIGDVWGTYDLDLEPADITTVPHWTEPGIALPRDRTVKDVGHDIQLTDPAYIHGNIADPVGMVVPQAEIRIYAISTNEAACLDAVNPPPNCVVPAIQVAHATADDGGTIQFTLAR